MLDTFKPKNTLAVFYETISFIKKFVNVVNGSLQLLFIAFYCYSIYINLENTHKLIFFSAFLVLELLGSLIFIVATVKDKKDSKRKIKIIKKVIIYSKLVVKLFVCAFSLYTIINGNLSGFRLFMEIMPMVCLVICLIIRFICEIIEKYLNLFIAGIEMDALEIANSKLGRAVTTVKDAVKNPAATIIDVIDKPFERALRQNDNENGGEETQDVKQEKVDKTKEKYRKKVSKLAQKQEELNKEKKEQKQEQDQKEKQERLNNSVNKFKSHIKEFFGLNDDDGDSTEEK